VIGACQKAPEFTAADEAGLKSQIDSANVWIKARKFDLWVGRFADDAFLQPPNAKTATGHTALLAWANALPPMEALVFSNVQVTGDGNMAMGTTDYTLKFQGAPADTGKQIVVFRRSADGKWKTIGVSFSSDLPPIAMPAAPAKAAKK